MKQPPGDAKKLGFGAAHMEKRQQLIDADVDPYPYSFDGIQRISDIIATSARREENREGLGFPVTAAGRVWARREMPSLIFIDLRDETGKIQLALRKSRLSDRLETILKCIDIGDIVGVRGKMFRTETNALSIDVEMMDVLAKTVVPVPIGKESKEKKVFHRIKDVESQYRERYLTWLLNDEARSQIICRSRIIDSIRDFMRARDFLEVSTPAIEPVYGGAEARPFRTSIWALEGKEAFLRISPELYLKRYIVAGFDRVFTICQNFRNEGIDRSHNPEFTMMEWYEAYTDYEYQMTQFEALVSTVCKDIHGKTAISYQGVELDFTPPWRRISVLDALREEGIDAANMSAQELHALAGQSTHADDSWGVAVAVLFEKHCEPKLEQPTFVIDHPLEISPLTKVKRGDPRLVERFEPFVFRMELGNAYSELTDPVEQVERLRSQRRGRDRKDYEDHPLDADFIKAVGCGMPPTGGVGLGVDRLIMLLTNAPSIRDIIPFPMVKSIMVP